MKVKVQGHRVSSSGVELWMQWIDCEVKVEMRKLVDLIQKRIESCK